MSIYMCERCDNQKDGDWDCPTEVGGEMVCESCMCEFPEDWEDYIITFDQPPIPTKQFDWRAVHKDYDGAPDSNDYRAFTAPNVFDLVDQILEFNEEMK